MIDSNKDVSPSMLRNKDVKYDAIIERIKTVKGYAESLRFKAPEAYQNDEHYWFTVMKRYSIVSNILREAIPNKVELKKSSLFVAMNEADEFIIREKEKATDGLTNAWSRIASDNFLEILRAKQRKGVKTGVLLLDVDYFKDYNTKHGHPKADEILKELVKTTRANTRATDMTARYGGEEFFIILTDLPEELSETIITDRAEVIRQEITKNMGVTVSIGATLVNESDQNIIDIYERADKNLYTAKNSGRNIVCSDNGLVPKKI
jgi:diguanylate cyclase (GGDEF)-like protein